MNKNIKRIYLYLFTAVVGLSMPTLVFGGGSGEGFKTSPNGLQYRIIKDNKQRKAIIGDILNIHLVYKTDKDSVIFSSRALNANKPLEIPVTAIHFKGDPTEGYTLVGAGDSAVFKVSVDSIFKGQPMPPYAKHGSYTYLYVQVVSVTSKEEYEANKKAAAEKQKTIDDDLIKNYIKDKGLTNVQKTETGLYYVVQSKGAGGPVTDGMTINVNYTGRLLNGKIFDSNMDSAFHHVQAFSLTIGKKQVIKGWEEGLKLYNIGGKGTLIIPSGLAYGSMARGEALPANSVLVFDVEVVQSPPVPSIEEQKSIDDDLIKAYIKNKGLTNVQKTESGLYYIVQSKGIGAPVMDNMTIDVNYTGKLLNDKTFDSNVDSAFHHVQPFSLTIGKKQVIKGWEEGLKLFNIGGEGILIIPSELAYGSMAKGEALPANSVLVFNVKVTGEKPTPPPANGQVPGNPAQR